MTILYKCDKCCKTFSHKNDYNRHINRKFSCNKNNIIIIEDKSIIEEELEFKKISCNKPTTIPQKSKKTPQNSAPKVRLIKNKEHICIHCNKAYSRSDSLKRHIDNSCLMKNQNDMEKETIYKKLLEKVEKQDEKIEKQDEKIKHLEKLLSDKNTSNTIQNITNNNNNNNTQNNLITGNTFNIQLLAFGKEDISHLTENDYKLIINKGFKSVQELLKSIHFNKNKPENHNIYISNMRDNYVMVFDGNKWELRDRKDTIDDLYDFKKDILEDKLDELIEKLPDYVIRKFKRFINDQKAGQVSNKIKEELKLILYNNKNISEETKSKLGLINK